MTNLDKAIELMKESYKLLEEFELENPVCLYDSWKPLDKAIQSAEVSRDSLQKILDKS